MRSKEWLAFFFIFISLFSLGGCEKEPVAKIGDVAPDFILSTLEGQEITLGQYKGKNIFLLFWTQGCVFCQTRSIILVNDIYSKGQQSGLVVLSINAVSYTHLTLPTTPYV